jgi:hypothetical protein
VNGLINASRLSIAKMIISTLPPIDILGFIAINGRKPLCID